MTSREVKHQPDAVLTFVYSDCLAAVAAMPAGYKVSHYLELAGAIEKEQTTRDMKRIYRRQLVTGGDPLAIPLAGPGMIKTRVHLYSPSTYTLRQRERAAWMLAYDKLHPRKETQHHA